jgi:hypothetical protein
MNITAEELYKVIVTRILKEEGRLKASIRELAWDALLESHSEADADKAMQTSEMEDVLFSLYDLLRAKGKENGYTMRIVPIKEEGGHWGMPYNFEYYFAKKSK